MTVVMTLLSSLWRWLSSNWTAIAVVIFNTEEKRVEDAKQETAKVQLQLDEANNEIDVEKKFDGKPDSDIIRDAVKGSGSDSKSS